jgi:hypothetical protein
MAWTSLTVLALLTTSATTKRASTSPWSTLAEQDLRAAHQAILENHPGPVDGLNPAFRDWLEGGFTQTLGEAHQVRSFGGYMAVLRRYVAGFRDGHLSVYFRATWNDTQWPGFLVSFHNGRYLTSQVDASDPSLPPEGAELLDCDDVKAEAMLEWSCPDLVERLGLATA